MRDSLLGLPLAKFFTMRFPYFVNIPRTFKSEFDSQEMFEENSCTKEA